MNSSSQGIGTRVSDGGSPNQGGRGREVLVAGRRAPASATATRMRHVRGLLGARKYIWRMTLIGGAVFLLGATTGKILAAVIPPLIVLAVIVGMVWHEATRLAERDFFAGFALDHQFNYGERMSLLKTTPLLSAGDRRYCEHYMEGQLDGVDGVAVGLAHFVYETRSEHARRRHRSVPVYAPHDFTIAVVDLPRAATVFPSLMFHLGVGKFGRDDWLDREGYEKVELQNAELIGRFDLLVDDDQDRERLRQLFKPTFQSWLADQPRQLFFEYSRGTLVVFVPKRAKDADTIYWLLDCTRWIAKRIAQEGEPLKAVASTPPPTGVAAFPPPPPATKPRLGPRLTPVPEPIAEPLAAASFARASVPPPSAH